MRRILFIFCTAFLLWGNGFLSESVALEYSWLEDYDPTQTIEQRIPVPRGYERVAVQPGSFQAWLRQLPLKEEDAAVLLFNGKKKARQDVHTAVINLDVGPQDLQQCADAVIRLRAEYLYTRQQYEALHFNFTSGDPRFISTMGSGLSSESQWQSGPLAKIAARERLTPHIQGLSQYRLHVCRKLFA